MPNFDFRVVHVLGRKCILITGSIFYVFARHASRRLHALRGFLSKPFYKSSAVAEMGDRLATIDRVVKLPVIYVGGKLPVTYR